VKLSADAFLAFAVFVVAWLGTGATLRYAHARDLIDHPNERSSHVTPTPRGGGLAIVLSFLAGLAALHALGTVNDVLLWGLGGGGLAVALVGFVDDHGRLSPRVRLIVHFLAVAWALYWLCGMPPLPVGGGYVVDGPAWTALGAVGLVWLLNLYNFMDGIDGIAGAEAVCVALGILALGGGVTWLLLAAAAAGFLVLDWPPARILMGNAGSGFLGFALGVLAVDAAAWELVPLASSAILLGVFVVDATVTLLHRWLRGERLSEAHRSHAYQHAARRFVEHRPVVLAVIVINGFWLLPWAWAAQAWPQWSMGAVVAALAPLAMLALRLGAGTVEGRA
jgi:Fuc2NAc and GlcNAc transferase